MVAKERRHRSHRGGRRNITWDIQQGGEGTGVFEGSSEPPGGKESALTTTSGGSTEVKVEKLG
jgi:hypothetical protein